MNPEEEKLVQDLAASGMKIRAIARKLNRDVKTVRRALHLPHEKPKEPKLKPYREAILEMDGKGFKVPRILREIRQKGYTGSRTILQEFLRKNRGPRKPARKVFRRFETPAGLEAQIDWSTYRVLLGGILTVVHCFSMILAYSRMVFVAFYRNERLPTLLHAHVEAMTYFGGLCRRHIYDNMATVVLGRSGGKPIWNPAFLEFARHYGFTPWPCRVKDPNRKGKIESIFSFLFSDFLQGSSFESWDDLNARVRVWLDTVANRRVHSTTRRVPAEMFSEERPFLIRLPEVPYPTERREVRKVQTDGYVPVDGSLYPVPASLVGQYVTARVFPGRVEVLDGSGQVAAAHKVPDRPCRLPADWGPPAKCPAAVSRTALEARFLAHFPEALEFLEGLQRRMKSLTPIHLRHIGRLVDLYGEARVQAALDRALAYRNFSALALARILETDHPDVVPEPPVQPPSAGPVALAALDDLEEATPEDYDLDRRESTEGDDHGSEE